MPNLPDPQRGEVWFANFDPPTRSNQTLLAVEQIVKDLLDF